MSDTAAETHNLSLRYRAFPTGALRELRLRDGALEWLFAGRIVEVRGSRRVCDFQNAAESVRAGGAVIVEAGEPRVAAPVQTHKGSNHDQD